MALAWTGEDEMETVIAAWEATAAFAADAQEAVIAALFSSLIEALHVGQTSTTRTRWAELLVDSNGDKIAPVAAQAIMHLATNAKTIRTELNQVASGPTAQNNEDAYQGDGYDADDLEAAH